MFMPAIINKETLVPIGFVAFIIGSVLYVLNTIAGANTANAVQDNALKNVNQRIDDLEDVVKDVSAMRVKVDFIYNKYGGPPISELIK